MPCATPQFKEIAEQSEELLNYPAYHMYDANYGGTVYQMIEYNGKLYMAINAGQKALHSTLNPTEGEIHRGRSRHPGGDQVLSRATPFSRAL